MFHFSFDFKPTCVPKEWTCVRCTAAGTAIAPDFTDFKGSGFRRRDWDLATK
jgi:hypothetical protein